MPRVRTRLRADWTWTGPKERADASPPGALEKLRSHLFQSAMSPGGTRLRAGLDVDRTEGARGRVPARDMGCDSVENDAKHSLLSLVFFRIPRGTRQRRLDVDRTEGAAGASLPGTGRT